jgi:hypothetical protein
MKRLTMVAMIVAVTAALAACQTATPYQPLKMGAASGGYSEIKLEHDRWRVTFSGNSVTPRQTVENYLLYRAAELTAAKGYDWFETLDRRTEKQSQIYVEPIGQINRGWSPYWRYHGSGFGWRTWDPYRGGPFWADQIDVRTVNQYEASAEIVMGRGPKPGGGQRVFDARELLANLASNVVKPS